MATETSTAPLTTLPFQGEQFLAEKKLFKETILFVPFYGGSKKSLQRHVQLANSLGYDCMSFELEDDIFSAKDRLFNARGEFGFKHLWADQIEKLLTYITGPKILYSFSNPSASAIEVIARRRAVDISGLICDGGPSSQLFFSMVNYFTHEKPLRFLPAKFLASAGATFLWHPNFLQVIHDDLKDLPKGFKILSIRGWKDPLITPQMIDKVFEPHTNIDWRKLSLPQAAHLNGLKDFSEEYVPPVKKFLEEISHKI